MKLFNKKNFPRIFHNNVGLRRVWVEFDEPTLLFHTVGIHDIRILSPDMLQ